TVARAPAPGPSGNAPHGTRPHASIRTPCAPVHGPAMSTQHASRHPSSEAFHLPEAHYALGAGTGELGAIGTPVQVVEAGIVALEDAHALPPLYLPQPQRAILTATEQAAAVGREGQAVHRGAMALQHHPSAAKLRIPQPDRVVPAATGQRASIWAPGHGLHLLRMPHQRLAQAKAACLSQLPQL